MVESDKKNPFKKTWGKVKDWAGKNPKATSGLVVLATVAVVGATIATGGIAGAAIAGAVGVGGAAALGISMAGVAVTSAIGGIVAYKNRKPINSYKEWQKGNLSPEPQKEAPQEQNSVPRPATEVGPPTSTPNGTSGKNSGTEI